MHLETSDKNNFLFPGKIKGKLYSGVMKKRGMSQRVIRQKDFVSLTVDIYT